MKSREFSLLNMLVVWIGTVRIYLRYITVTVKAYSLSCTQSLGEQTGEEIPDCGISLRPKDNQYRSGPSFQRERINPPLVCPDSFDPGRRSIESYSEGKPGPALRNVAKGVAETILHTAVCLLKQVSLSRSPIPSCLLLILLCLAPLTALAQYTISGYVTNKENDKPISGAKIYNNDAGESYGTDEKGYFEIKNLTGGTYHFYFYAPGYHIIDQTVFVDQEHVTLEISLRKLHSELSGITINEKGNKTFSTERLREVEGTAIYAGKKNNVVVLNQLVANVAANNARQIYAQVPGLNIYSSSNAGLQLNIGGRGLDPNRSANFNTRQNGYDISADVLGYPESYYTPPAAALEEIQIIRGAASLQYGTQFGGLVNFILKKPHPDRNIAFSSRVALGSNKLLSSFNSLSGTVGKISYLTYFNYKKGDGFRPNSGFDSKNFYAHIGYDFTPNTSLVMEFTRFYYLAQQPGGLTDAQFYKDPVYSNRTRNWFEVNWNLYSLKFSHRFTARTEFSLNMFGLDASRKAVGFRTNRVSQTDDLSAPRDLISGEFNNGGAEARLLHRYSIANKRSVFLIGSKYYQSHNTAIQGPGTADSDSDFHLADQQFPYYPNQSNFVFPNSNMALFGENIFYLSENFLVTPGFRFEYIKTGSKGTYKKIDFDLAGNPIYNATFEDNRSFERSFVLLGIGASYYPVPEAEIYGNFSQNYRSVTFSDIRVVNPSYQIDPDISDEKGFTADAGVRGTFGKTLSYDLSGFGLLYDDRLGEVLRAEQRLNADGEVTETGRIVRYRGNIGKALVYGLESLLEWNVLSSFSAGSNDSSKLNWFVNTALTRSKYIDSEIAGVEGNKVEFVPFLNFKTGVNFGYRNLHGILQYTYLSKQYTDASNAEQNVKDNQSGIKGSIPAYGVADFSLSYRYSRFKLEGGINNLFNNSYFTRRATGYPGPGIIPALPRKFYMALQVKL